MALPQQAIEKLSRGSRASQGVYKELLLLAFGLFFFALILFLGLRYGYINYLENSGRKLDQEIEQWSQGISSEDQAATAVLYSQLYNLRTLLGSRAAASPIFDLLERTTLPEIYYTKLGVNTLNREVTVSGAARSLEKIAEQAARIEREPQVERVTFTSASKPSDNPWQFTMAIILREEALRETSVRPVAAPEPRATSTP